MPTNAGWRMESASCRLRPGQPRQSRRAADPPCPAFIQFQWKTAAMALPPDSLYARGFAADTRTWRALRDGLAGRKVKIQRGRLAVALQTLASEPASKLLFVDLDGANEPEVAGRDLAAVCAFETAVIAIGSTDTAQFTRTLFRYGIADYLVKPITPSLVREASAALTDDLPERSYAGRVVAFLRQCRLRNLHAGRSGGSQRRGHWPHGLGRRPGPGCGAARCAARHRARRRPV